MSKSDQQSKIILFIKEVAKYFMDFLETDFHKRRLPKRSIQLHSKDNLLVGLNLNKYPSFNRLSWDLVISTFDKNKFNALQKGIYRADIPQNLVDIVKIQVKKLSEEQLADVLNEVATKVQEAIALFPKDFEQAINYAIDKASVVLKAHLIIPFITKLEQPLETLALGDENINYLMEEELTTVIMQLMEKTISETLKHAAAGEEIDAKNNLMTAIQINEVKSTIKSFFENFQVFDLYNEVYEMSRNKAILDKQEFYFYFSDISYNRVKYPIFYIPFSVEKSGESLVFEFDAQLYINKKALEYIAQQYNEERGKFGSIKGISERIIYLAQHLNNLTNVLQPIMDELTDFFELDARIKVTSSILCHPEDGACSLLGILIDKDSIEDSIHARPVTEDPHGSCPPFYLTEYPFNGVGGPHLLPEGWIRERKTGQQFIEVIPETLDCPGINILPSVRPLSCVGACLLIVLCCIDLHQASLDSFLVDPSDLVHDVAHLVSPASLQRDQGIDRTHRADQSFAPINRDDFCVFTGEPPPAEVR